MQPLSVAKILPGILFFLLAAFSPTLPCVAVTIEEIYDDDAGEGFLDGTDLTQAEKDFLATRRNNAETLGEARKNAFEHATSILESRLTNTNTIRISANFVIFDGQEDSNDPDRCGTLTPGTYTIASAKPRGYGYPGGRFDEGDASNPGLGTAYPYALFEALSGQEFNEQEADLSIRFSKCIPFYYGFTESPPANQIDFIRISLHEAMHGLGFLEHVEDDGSFPLIVINITETLNGIIIDQRQATIRSRTTYDEQLYSETDDDLFIDLTNSERAAAIISEDGLLWEGTDGGRNPCSYGQRMAELKTSSAKSQDGKPRLHAPSPYDPGGSVSHLHENAGDLMEPFYPSPRNMDLTLGMLKDMGWGVSANGFPSDCEPSGITVTPEAGLVTTEAGGKARFEVKLKSKPTENVTVSVTSNDESEGVPDPNPLELTFTPSTWNTLQVVEVVGVDDGLQDGPQDYSVELKVDSDDRFYAVIKPKLVSLRNEDDDSLLELFIGDADAEEKDGVLDFVVDLSDTTAGTVTVQYAITGGTAQEGTDYAAAPPNATITLAPGEKETTISVPLIYDNLDEYPDVETLTVTLSNPQGATFAQNGSTATGTIRDSDQATLRIEDASAGEDAGTMNFTVRLSPQSVRTVTAQYSITGGAAQGGSDYEAASSNGTVTFAPGESRNTISITLIDDGEREANETVAVTLSNPQNAVLAQNGGTATGTIRDNDQPPPPPPPPPLVDNQVTDNMRLPPGTPPAQEPAENPQQPEGRPPATPRPPSAGEEGGGGGCAIASGEGADHTVSTLLNLLPAVFAAFSLLSLKNRP